MKNKRGLRALSCVLVAAVAGVGCGDDGNGGSGSVDSAAGLQAFMESAAADLAQVLADVAPDLNAFSAKGGADNSTSCPDGGTATWSGGSFSGSLSMQDCGMGDVEVTGTMGGFLERVGAEINATMLSGPVSVSGAVSGEVNVTNLTFLASLPYTVETTFWIVEARDDQGSPICAGSGPNVCDDFGTPPSGGSETIRTGGTCNPDDEFNDACQQACDFGICTSDEVAQVAECVEGACRCTCVNYDL